MNNHPYKIFLVDDHTLFRNGLRGLLNARPDCEVIGEASSGEEFLEKLPEDESVDIVFMDIAMPGISGDETTARALEMRPDLKVITLSMFGDEDYYYRMVSVGAKGFLLKSSDIDEVTTAIETVANGGSYFSQELLDGLMNYLQPAPQPAPVVVEEEEALSERELEVLIEICKGLSNQQIADKLFISKRTVDKHRANILDKTGCSNTANLVVYAIKHNLVEI
ncbi:MAG: response regulator transcription factor [Rikenellaceae bacterium]|nr:response regulator transcription factor [Rikenellaceae bacterium]